MKPLADLDRAEAAGLTGLLFDLDETFLDDGRLTETAYAALGRLSRAGLTLVAVTGRPAGFGEVLARQWPVRGVVTENGAAYPDAVGQEGRVRDAGRLDYLARHVAAAAEALAAGVPLTGYYVWSLLDNYEWSLGYSRRFGLVHVDFDSQRRTPKESARWYQRLIARE